jgi:hypothetical protein
MGQVLIQPFGPIIIVHMDQALIHLYGPSIDTLWAKH